MAAPFFSTPFQPYVYQSQQSVVTPFQILGGEAQILQIMLKSQDKVTAKPLDDGFVGISAPSPARILPIDLANFGGEILYQPDAFLCSLNDVVISSTVDQRARNMVSGAEVVLKQKLVGQGLAFLVGGGSVVQKILDVGEVVVVDAACIVAMTTTINFQVKYSHPARRAVFGGDNQLTASLTGPGVVFIQSLPFHRLSQRIARAVAPPGMRENPKFFIQIAVFFFLAYVMIVSSLILTDI